MNLILPRLIRQILERGGRYENSMDYMYICNMYKRIVVDMVFLQMKTHKFFSKVTSAIVVIMVFGVCISPASRASNGSAAEFIQEVGYEAIQSLTDKALDDQQRKDRFREILNQKFKIKLVARFTLGRYWRIATKEQQKEYNILFEDFIVLVFATRFRDFSGDNFSVGKVHHINARDQLVDSKFVLKDGTIIPVYWRVRSGDAYKIIDVFVEGVSMAITHRDEFAYVISREGGKIEGLLAALRKKTGRN